MKLHYLYRGLTKKSRLILSLLIDPEMTFNHLKSLTVSDLKRIINTQHFDDTLKQYANEELIFGKHTSDRVFSNPSGRPYSSTDIEKILKRAHERNGYQYRGRIAYAKKYKNTVTLSKG